MSFAPPVPPTDPPATASITPPTPSPSDPPIDAPIDPPAARRRLVSRLSPAGWLATVGASMLLLAAIVVVAGRWESISPEVRFSGLVAALVAVYSAAETLRSRVRLTATALATLAAALTAPVGIAAAATLEQEWPVCVLVGGIAALLATELQSRRWRVPPLRAATTVAAGLTATGLAALIDVPVGVVGAIASAVFLLFGATKRSVVLAAAVGATPLLILVAESGIGEGTLARLGATGPTLTWAAPLGAAIAACVIAVTAQRRREPSLVGLTAATLASGLLVGGATADLTAAVWWSMPGAALLLVETVAAFGRRSVWSEAANRIRLAVLAPVALVGATTPALLAFVWIAASFGDEVADPQWTLPLTITAVALWVATAGVHRTQSDSATFTPLFLAAAATTVAASMSLRPDRFGWIEAATLAAIALVMSAVSTTRSARWAHAAAVLFVLSGSWSCALLGLTATHTSLVMVAAAAVLAGIGFLQPRYNAVDTASIVTAALAVIVALAAPPAVLSIALTLLSALGVLYGLAALHQSLAAVSGAGFVASLVSLWWTSGANVAAISAIAPYGADGGDLSLFAATGVLLGVGVLIRRSQGVSSWLAYGPGLGMAAAWLLATQLDDDATWATLLALTIGVAATAVGAARRLGAPLLIGTAMIIASVAISAGSRLAAAPTWLWIAAGGIGLIVLAAAIERTDRPLVVGDESQRSILQQFCHDYD